MALMIRAELFEPGLQIMRPEFFNQLTTMHGLIMVFGAIMPAFVGFANWQIPLQIGASDMAFSADEQLQLLAAAGGRHPADHVVLRSRRRDCCWLDVVCTALHADGPGHGLRHFRDPLDGCVVDHGRYQYRRDDPEFARPA